MSSYAAPALGRRQFNQYPPNPQGTRNKVIAFLVVTAAYTGFLYSRSEGAKSFLGKGSGVAKPRLGGLMSPASAVSKEAGMKAMVDAKRTLSIATWNIAAINNNPFEYWITMDDDPNYEKLMKNVEDFLENTGERDVLVSEVFTEEMYTALEGRMSKVGWESVKSFWDDDFKKRKIVSGFLKDPTLGSKRLASMPDRVTNTINVVTDKPNEDGSPSVKCRPTVINMYEEDLSTMDKWWKAWEAFMFDDALQIKGSDGSVKPTVPYEMLLKIKKSKYPAVTEEEERLSLPLQTLCGAIFDGILVHMMNSVVEPETWQSLKRKMIQNLIKKKVPRTLEILETTYGESDIITLQEVSSALVETARAGPLGKKFHIIAPADADTSRDQNSVILLNRKTFPDGSAGEITEKVKAAFPQGVDVPVANGDILAIKTADVFGLSYIVTSFHGDTNGLATVPVLDALVKATGVAQEWNNGPAIGKESTLIFGLDANTYETVSKPGEKEDVLEFGKNYVGHKMTSCWGDVPQPSNYTTFNARTYLQPQLNKACKSTEKRAKGDVNPKDFILFPKKDFQIVKTWKDNNGDKTYTEDMAFPTLKFPSDHGVLATILTPPASKEKEETE